MNNLQRDKNILWAEWTAEHSLNTAVIFWDLKTQNW